MNKKLIYIISGVFTWLVLTTQVFAFSNSDDLIKEANKLFIEYKDNEALSKFQTVLQTEPSHYEALYKSSLLNSRIGSRYADETEKLEYFAAAKGYAQMALAANPYGAEANYVMALALHNLTILTSVKDRLTHLKTIRLHLDHAIADNPKHADAWQLLGRWHYRAANLNFLECTISKFLTGSIPAGASNYNAIEALKKSIALNPQNISGYLDLAIIYADINKKEEAARILQKSLTLNLVTAEELEISRRCKTMLSQLHTTGD